MKAVVPAAASRAFTQFDCCWGNFRETVIDSDSAERGGEVEAQQSTYVFSWQAASRFQFTGSLRNKFQSLKKIQSNCLYKYKIIPFSVDTKNWNALQFRNINLLPVRMKQEPGKR